MCKVGDIIVVKNYISQGRALNRHSFVILNADRGEIQGLDYDLVCNVMSSFHSEAERKKKLSYPGNFEYPANGENIKNGNEKEGYIKAEQFYYFDSSKTDFYVLGTVTPELFEALIEFISQLTDVEIILDNLK